MVRLAERAGGLVVETGWSGRWGQAHAGVRPFRDAFVLIVWENCQGFINSGR